MKIWKLIASTPLSIGICHEEIPPSTQANIWYEVGVAQGLGKETVIAKSIHSDMPSDFVRTEYVEFDEQFEERLGQYLKSLDEQADHYEMIADQLESNPVLSIDYLRRAYQITGDSALRTKVQELMKVAHLNSRAKNSVEYLAANF